MDNPEKQSWGFLRSLKNALFSGETSDLSWSELKLAFKIIRRIKNEDHSSNQIVLGFALSTWK